MKTFEELGVSPEIRRAIEEMGYEQPMPVQEEVIPYLLGENNDVVALAQTGTGKTAAFGLPLIQKINVNNRIPQSLILCPTRELCLQIAGDLNDYSKYTDGLRACRKLVGVSGGRRDVEVVVAEAVVFHDDVFVHSKGGKHKCRYDACAPFARRAMDNDGIIVLVQQNIENPAVFFGVVADELAVHLLHDSVDSIALDFLFLYTFQDILHVAGRNGDMDHFECLLQRALSIRFDR